MRPQPGYRPRASQLEPRAADPGDTAPAPVVLRAHRFAPLPWNFSPDGRRHMSNIGLPEIAIVLLIVLVIFGPKRLPQLGRSLGSGMREFKDAVTGNRKHDDDDEMPGLPSPPPDPAERVTTTAAADETAAGNRPKAADAS